MSRPGRSGIRRRRRSLALLAAGPITAAALAGAGPAGAQADEGAPELTLIEQTFVVPGVSTDAGLSITVDGTALGTPAQCTTESPEIRVVSYRPVVTREDANAALDDPGAAVDEASYKLCELTRNQNGTVTLTVATTIQVPTDPIPTVLRLPSAGVIPIGVEVRRAGDVDASFVTFVDRLDTGTDAATNVAEPMKVAVALLVDGGPTLQPDGSTQVSEADRVAVGNAVDLLGKIGEAPITIGVRPELVEGLSRSAADSDRGRYTELQTALAGVDLLSLPYVALDPSAAATSGLATEFTKQLTLGENALGRLLPDSIPLRVLWLFDQSVSAEGAEMLRAAGVRLGALLPPQGFSLSPPDRQFEIDYGDGTLPATPVDRPIAEAMADPGTDPTLTAYHLAAQVLLTRQEAIDADQGRAPMRDHNMILSTPTGRIGNVETTAKLIELLGGTPQLSLVAASSITSTSIPDLDGQPYREPPPAKEIPSLAAVGKELTGVGTDVDAFASMLPDGDERPAAWRSALDVAMSSAIDADRREAYLATVRGGIEEIRAAIVPPRSSRFTLGGRHSTIRLTLTNHGTVDLKVRVIISSDKLDISDEDEDRIVTLPAGATQEEKVPVEARTNGEFPVDIKIVTPADENVAITDPVQLTARVNALTGLGQLATGAFVLVLLSWWVQHIRKRRRAAAAAATT